MKFWNFSVPERVGEKIRRNGLT